MNGIFYSTYAIRSNTIKISLMKTQYLKNYSKSPIVYFLNTDDVQNISKEHIGRNLTPLEIEKLIEPLAENINWAEAIELAIEQTIESC